MSNLFLPGFWPHVALYVGDAFIEAKKDGVKVRRLEETLAVDSVLILRPAFPADVISSGIDRARIHVGKGYDFLFDFRQSERLACTAVVYRAYHGSEGHEFELSRQSGRLVLTAEDLVRQLVGTFGFSPVAACGIDQSGCGASVATPDQLSKIVADVMQQSAV